MTTMDPSAIPLAKKVLDRITSEPLAFDMSDWFDVKNTEDFCGTSACLAGWAMILSGQFSLDSDGIPQCRRPSDGFEKTGARLLGLNAWEAGSLFYLEDDEAIERLQQLIDGAHMIEYYDEEEE